MMSRQFRILLIVLTVVSGCLGGAASNLLFRGASAVAQAGEKVVTANKFRLVDSEGRDRGALQMVDGRPSLRLYDAAGKTRFGLGVAPDGTPGLGLYDAAGKPRFGLVVRPDGSSGLALYDAAGKTRAGLGVGADGTPGLGLYDAEGNKRVQLAMGADGSSGLGLFDATGKPRAMLDVWDGKPSLSIRDAEGNKRAVVGCMGTVDKNTGAETKWPESTITLYKANGDVLWQAPWWRRLRMPWALLPSHYLN